MDKSTSALSFKCGAFPVKKARVAGRGSLRKSLGAAHADGTPAAVDVRSPVRDPVGDAGRHLKGGKETAAAAESGF